MEKDLNNFIGSVLDNLMIESPSTAILLTLTIVVAIGFLITRLTRLLHLPDATGYIVAGILIGPSVLNLIPTSIAENFDFISDIALGFIAFGVGKYVLFEKDSSNIEYLIALTNLYITEKKYFKARAKLKEFFENFERCSI